jgi:hypothetical protein
MFKLQEITAMKLQSVVQLNTEIQYAIEHKLPKYQAECEKELVKTKYEAMHPQVVLDKVTRLLHKQH